MFFFELIKKLKVKNQIEQEKKHFESIKHAVTLNGSLLRFASPKLRKNEEIVKLALGNNPLAIEYVDKDYKNSEEFEKLKFVTEENKEINLVTLLELAIDKNPFILEFVPEKYKNDRNVVEKAAKKNTAALLFASDELKNSKDFITSLVVEKKIPQAIAWASPTIRNDENYLRDLKLRRDCSPKKIRELLGVSKDEKDIQNISKDEKEIEDNGVLRDFTNNFKK